MQLSTAENRYPHQPGLDVAERVVFLVLACPAPTRSAQAAEALIAYLAGTPMGGKLDARPEGLSTKASTRAEARQGRWLAGCPWCEGHYQLTSSKDPRFFCTDCRNARVGGKFIPVEWPDEAEKIDALLVKRPRPENRNWAPGETVEDLAVENLRHAVV